MAARSVLFLAVFLIFSRLCSAQPVPQVAELLPYFFQPKHNRFLAIPESRDTTIIIVVYTAKNCYPCFAKCCAYLASKGLNGRTFYLDFRARRKVEALYYDRGLTHLFPCAEGGGLYLLKDSLKQDPAGSYLMNLPSPYFIIHAQGTWYIEGFLQE